MLGHFVILTREIYICLFAYIQKQMYAARVKKRNMVINYLLLKIFTWMNIYRPVAQ